MGQCQEFFGQVLLMLGFPCPVIGFSFFVVFSKSVGDIAKLMPQALIPVTTVRKLVADVSNTFNSLFFANHCKKYSK